MASQPKGEKTPPADDRVLVIHLRGAREEAAYLRDLAKQLGLGVTETFRLAVGRLGQAQGFGEYPATRSVGRPPAELPAETTPPGDQAGSGA